jgi:predicted NUDIX family NTP pyrophosphohydrolase
LYSSPNIIRIIIKSRRMRWAGHVARMGETMNADKILVAKPEGTHWEDQDVGGWTILKWFLER